MFYIQMRMFSSEFIDDFATRFLAAWNARDGDAVASLCTPDVIWRDPAAPEPLTGQDAVREFVEMTATAFPDFRIVETSSPYVSRDTPRVLAPYRMTGTMLGPLAGFAPTGRTVAIDGVDDWLFRDGLLSGYSTHYDTIDAARQLGVMPMPGTLGDKLFTRLQHGQARIQRRHAPVWKLYYAGWRPGPARVGPDQPVFVSVTDFQLDSLRWAPAAWRTGLRLRRSWPRLEGAVGIWLWAEPHKLRSGAVSVWVGEDDLVRFLRSPVHRAIVRDYRPRMHGTSSGWTAPRFDRAAIWQQAVGEITRLSQG
jgi:steroid delta-isomerase-like uncharacterized protein